MYWPVLLHNKCLAIVFCGLITISHATLDAPPPPSSHDSGQRTAGGGGGGNAQQQQQQHQQQHNFHQNQQQYKQHQHIQQQNSGNPYKAQGAAQLKMPQQYHGSGHSSDNDNSYTMLSKAMSQVSHEFSGAGAISGSADGACLADDIECTELQDQLGMEAIRSLHQQLDDDENGNIDLTESDDFLREELKYDSGYEKRHKTFHYNDDTQISVKELWEAWLRSEVHNWTIEQTTDWLSQSVQLPQYVEIFQKHKVSGQTLPRLAVHNMHYVSNVLGIRDPIHKQKIALKAMDVVLFGPPRETGTRWKDYILVTLLLSAIIGCWYAYQQNKNAKRHLRRMAKDMEGLQKAENALTEMQKELELARLEQENVATEKLDLERRLKEAPSLSASSSDLEVQQLKQEIEMLRSELSRAEVELVDHCWTPPPALQSWLQLTYELESKHTLKKRIMAEKQLQAARDACEKLKRKRSSLVGAFVSTHGKSIDDVDRSIVEARNSLGEVTNELQERLHRWKQIEMLLGFSIVNNNGIAYLESVLYNRNGSGKSSRSRISGSQDELDDESVQGYIENHGRFTREDSSGSDDGGDSQSTIFIIGSGEFLNQSQSSTQNTPNANTITTVPITITLATTTNTNTTATNSVASSMPLQIAAVPVAAAVLPTSSNSNNFSNLSSAYSASAILNTQSLSESNSLAAVKEENRPSTFSLSQDKIAPLPRNKKTPFVSVGNVTNRATSTPMPPPRRANSHQSFVFNHFLRSQSADVEPMEPTSSFIVPASTKQKQQQQQQQYSESQLQLDDTYSTDSSSFDDELKKRRRKLRFPFSKKSFHKNKHI